MARKVHWRDTAWALLMEVPAELRKEALAAVVSLMDSPLPAGEPYEPVPDTWRLATAYVTVWYRMVGEEVDVVYLRANS